MIVNGILRVYLHPSREARVGDPGPAERGKMEPRGDDRACERLDQRRRRVAKLAQPAKAGKRIGENAERRRCDIKDIHRATKSCAAPTGLT